MRFGPAPPARLPKQLPDVSNLLINRWERAGYAQNQWAEQAKECVDFFEGKQWDEVDLFVLDQEKRPHYTFNLIKPLIMLVLGYHRNQRTDTKYVPTGSGPGNEEISEILGKTVKSIHTHNEMPFIDSEVFLDGIQTGRGFYEAILDFQENDLGEVKYRSVNPFSVYIDPDADSYNPQDWNYVQVSRWISFDEVEAFYGREAGKFARAFMGAGTSSQLPSGAMHGVIDVAPASTFAQAEDALGFSNALNINNLFDFVDTTSRTIRLIKSEYVVWTDGLVLIDLETGDKVQVPDHWTRQKLSNVMAWAESTGNMLSLQRRRVRRIRMTHMIGDLMVWDGWSPYQTFSILPFFPYFRRGITTGMIHDLRDPQRQLNKMYTNEMAISGKTANGGWWIPKNSLDPENQERLRKYGSTAGVNIEYDPLQANGEKPSRMEQEQPGAWYERHQTRSGDMIKLIAGVNDSALGNLDRVQSGRAIEARQRQTVVGIEPYLDNYRRTQHFKGNKTRELVQNFYREPRIIRLQGDDGKIGAFPINTPDPLTGAITNNITLGKYDTTVDETPLSASFLAATFEELLQMVELGVPIPHDMIVDASSSGNKEEIKRRMAEQQQQMQLLGAGVPQTAEQAPPVRQRSQRAT